jgi:hypothetical protein
MLAPDLRRKRTPFDDVTPDELRDFAAFVRKHAPRWLSGSRSFARLTVRRARRKAVACDRRRGIRHVDTANPPSRMGSQRRR